MRGGKSAAALAVVVTALVASTTVSAHRLDECLQAARLSIEPGRVAIELDLTPGTAVADTIVADIDRDRDGVLSADEQRAYVRAVLDAVAVRIDGRTRRLDLAGAAFPALDALRRGEGTIRLQTAVEVPNATSGRHQLVFHNAYRRDVSVYLANALAPSSERIAITAQRRDPDQRELTIDYDVRTQTAAAVPAFLLAFAAGAVLLSVRRLNYASEPRTLNLEP